LTSHPALRGSCAAAETGAPLRRSIKRNKEESLHENKPGHFGIWRLCWPAPARQGVTYGGNLNGFHIDGLSDVKVGFFQDGTYAAANNNGTTWSQTYI